MNNFLNIPESLKVINRWVCWKFEQSRKIPMNPRGGKAMCNRPETWSNYKKAVSSMFKYEYDGIGFQLGDGILGVDLDNAINESGEITKEARDIVSTLDSYTEYSPSKTGLHILCFGEIPQGGRRKENIEMYSKDRYFTVTGDIFENRKVIENRTDEIKLVHEKYIQKKDITSHSSADQALCNNLAFLCENNSQKMDRLFRKSGLMRPKWDENRGGGITYGQRTINEAISKNHYSLNWEDPIPFDSLIDVPNFPVTALPKIIQEFVIEVSNFTQTSLEMAGCLILGAISTANQGKYKVQIKNKYSESLSLYVISSALPGERKSSVLELIKEPIVNYEKCYNEEHRLEIARNLSAKRCLDMKLKNYEDDYTKGKITEIEKTRVVEERANFKELHKMKIISKDVTMEKLSNLMARNHGRMMLSSDEGGIFGIWNGRYGNHINMEPVLNGYSGEAFSSERISREEDKVHSPALSIVLAVQPSILYKFVSNDEFRDIGFCGRFLYAMCDTQLGFRKDEDTEMDDDVRGEYHKKMTFMLNRNHNSEKALKLYLSVEANLKYREYRMIVEKRLGKDGEWEEMRDYGAKKLGAMLRIAGNFHCVDVDEPEKQPISLLQIDRAIEIIECLNRHAENLFAQAGKNSQNIELKYLLEKIKSFKTETISIRTFFRKVHRKFKNVHDLEKALKQLELYNHLIFYEVKHYKTKPIKFIKINPINLHKKTRPPLV